MYRNNVILNLVLDWLRLAYSPTSTVGFSDTSIRATLYNPETDPRLVYGNVNLDLVCGSRAETHVVLMNGSIWFIK